MKQMENTESLGASLSSSQRDSGVAVRAIMVALLSLTLAGAMRWALNVTNANARQISTNLTRLQGHYDTPMERGSGGSNENSFSRSRPSLGPTIEPETR